MFVGIYFCNYGKKFHQKNPSQTLMNLQYLMDILYNALTFTASNPDTFITHLFAASNILLIHLSNTTFCSKIYHIKHLLFPFHKCHFNVG